jgi:diguanylate cyclase (GGDEF)-like protein
MTTATVDTCLNYFSELLTVLRSTNQYEEVLHLITDRLVRTYKCQVCAIVLINQKTEYLSIENSIGLSHTFCKAFRRTLATGAIGELLWTGKPILIHDSRECSQLAQEVGLEHSFGSCLAVQLAVDHRTLGYMYADSREISAFTERDIRVLQAYADIASVAIHKARLHEENMRLDKTDHETGLDKYESFIEKLRVSLERAERFDEGFAIMILDVDNFKSLSLTYGYDASKQFLEQLGELVKGRLRNMDAGGRYGFDELIVLLSNLGLDEAVEFGRRLAEVVGRTPFTSHNIRSTISIGVAAHPQNGKTIDDLVLTAKNALFEAQRAGRNNVFHYSSEWHAKDAVLIHDS